MTPELIEAAARLCGWIAIDGPGHDFRIANDGRRAIHIPPTTSYPSELSDAGLIDLQKHLLKRRWELEWRSEHGFEWFCNRTDDYVAHPDFATAACMAAQKELENDAK